MKITVRVKPNARVNKVEKTDANSYTVSVAAPPAKGKANEKIIELLSDYFDKPKRNISIIHGAGGRNKLIEIL
jgi:uncharacterized protein (TIGR00251 family)